MEMYGQKSRSLIQKTMILTAELGLVTLSYLVLFGGALANLRAFDHDPSLPRNVTLFAFNLVVFSRFLLTLFAFLERRIPWEEAASVPMAFALYLLGFPLLARSSAVPFGWLELVGIILFVTGSFVNTFAELSRKRWKARPENRGKLYTEGLFRLSMHPNYFGDLLWVSGYACVTHDPYAALIPAFLFCFFNFYNVPKLDAYLAEHYGESFRAYQRRTKRMIPFVL